MLCGSFLPLNHSCTVASTILQSTVKIFNLFVCRVLHSSCGFTTIYAGFSLVCDCEHAVSNVYSLNNALRSRTEYQIICNQHFIRAFLHLFLTASDCVMSQGRSRERRTHRVCVSLCVYVFTKRVIFTSRARA